MPHLAHQHSLELCYCFEIESGAISSQFDSLKYMFFRCIAAAYAHTSTQRKANDGRQGNKRKTNFLSLTLGFFYFFFYIF